MKIRWLWVVLGGFLIEVVLALVLIGGFTAAGVDISQHISTPSAVIIGAGCFAGALVVVLVMTRRVAQPVLHGFLMGMVATILYVGAIAAGGQMSAALAAYGPVTFVIVNGARMVGAVVGGVLS